MHIAIHVEPNQVFIEGRFNDVDCTELAAQDIHAVQWYDDHGEVEFKSEYLPDEKREHREPNQHITDFTPYQPYVDAWIEQEKIALAEALRYRLEREKNEANMRKAEDIGRANFDRVVEWRGK